jgi:hypothetical protein
VTARGRRLAGVLAVAFVASTVAAPLVAAGVTGAGPPADAAGASEPTTTDQRSPAWTQARTLADARPCSSTHGLVDATTNATTVGTSVGIAGTPQPVAATAAAVAGSATTDDTSTTHVPRLTRRPLGPRTLCPTR